MELIATSGFNGKNGTKFDLNLYYDVISQDIANNNSTIRYYLYFTSNSGYSGSGATVTGKINGATVGTATSISARENKLMGTLDQTITHGDDGTFPNTGYTALIDTPWTLGDAEVAGTLTSANVPTIPRASSVSAGNGNINGLLGITIHRASDRFTHKLTYEYGKLTGDITQSAGAEYNWPVPDEFYTQIPEAREGIGTIHCYTMLDGNQVGNHTSCTFRVFTVENDCKPTVSATIVDTNKMLPTGVRTHTLTGSQDRLIKNISDVHVQINASPRKSAYLKSKKASCGDGQSGSGDSVVFYSVKSGSFTVYAQDSRDYTGYTNPSPIIKDMINYVPLTLNLNVYRPQPTTGEVSMDINGNYFNGSFGSVNNSLEVKYRYKESGGSYPETYETLTATIDTSNNRYSIHLDLGAEFDYQKSYDFEVIATDKVNIIPKTYHVPEGIPMLGLFKNYIEAFGEQAIINDNNYVHIGENIGVDIYSTNEKKVGVWIDGKPIYQKIITGSFTSSNDNTPFEKQFASNVDNIDNVVKSTAIIRYNGNDGKKRVISVPRAHYVTNEYCISMYYTEAGNNQNDIRIEFGSNYATGRPYEYYIFFRYTKTTD